MAKPDLGTKRLCPSCATRFYDLKKNPVVCPSCETAVPTEPVLKPKRAAAKEAAPVKAAEPAVVPDESEDELAEAKDIDVEVEDDEDDDEESLIENMDEDEDVSIAGIGDSVGGNANDDE